MIGLGRGLAHVAAILGSKTAKLSYICDVDKNRLEAGMKNVEGRKPEKMPTPIGDFRKMLDDPKLDAVFIATCNHWHSPAGILACTAGKHVYVEKPGSHNAYEGELLVAAAQEQAHGANGQPGRTWPALAKPCRSCEMEPSVRSSMRGAGTTISGRRSGREKWCLSPRRSTIPCGRAQRQNAPTKTMSFPTTGIGTGITAVANSPTTAFTPWMSPAGGWVSIIQPP